MDLLNSLAARCRERIARDEQAEVAPPITATPDASTPDAAAPKIAPVVGTEQGLGLAISPNYLTRLLDNVDRKPEASRVGTGGYTHVSTLTRGVCPRQHALTARFGKPEMESVTGAHRIMWGIGRFVEDHIRQTTITATEGRVIGDWLCKCGATKRKGLRPAATPENKCGSCGSYASAKYREMALLDHDHEITGSCDLPIQIDGFVMPYEIKSMTKDPFDALSAPLTAHVAQVSMYHWLLERNGYRVTDNAALIYCRKEFKWGSPYKEFHFNVRDAPYQTIIRSALDTAMAIKIGKKTGGRMAPRLPACSIIDAPAVKKCPVAAMCFQSRSGTDDA